MLKVLIADEVSDIAAQVFTANGIDVVVATGLGADALAAELADVDGLVVRSSTQVSAELLAAADASRELRLFGLECALRVLNRERHEGREPHSRFWDAVEAAHGFLEESIALPVPSPSSINSTCSCSSTASVPRIYATCSSIPAGASHSSSVWVSPSA